MPACCTGYPHARRAVRYPRSVLLAGLHPALNAARLHLGLLASFAAILAWSAWHPKDGFIWFLESVPAIVGAIVLVAIYRKTRLTTLVYGLIWLHAIVLVVGGHYTYAEMPLFNWIRDTFDLSRNYYDRVGHVMQGFVPAMIAREILLRQRVVTGRRWLFFLVTCICLAISAFYEFIEWWVAIASGEAADAFLATQGDVWDTQWDMFLAFVGAMASQLVLGALHDRQLTAFGVRRE
jgi:putative membrane protein